MSISKRWQIRVVTVGHVGLLDEREKKQRLRQLKVVLHLLNVV